ncbi:sulfotransferase domain-containing protein [Nitrospirillum iridis]|uniref:Sulfotransferase domain-containing protein n=1 Tax=Nitrospirillum iridis TaxID=765888 RepID=A0A7X0EFA4_9PROT|nr:sulfotransferase domain-containing protein [Nitrospirillum iridis]MBB6253815.1 hypothetical protein [Nitrospirillum iridis]
MIVNCVGLPGSASTWVYNVVRAFLAASGQPVAALYASNFTEVERSIKGPRSHYVTKCHTIDDQSLYLNSSAGVPFVLSSRDPRDSVASIMTRFDERTEASCSKDIMRSVASLFSARQVTRNILLSYEDLFSDKIDTLYDIAAFLDIRMTSESMQQIFEKFSKESVRSFIGSLEDLPSSRLKRDDTGKLIGDTETQFWSTHMGDAQPGKWRALREPFQTQVARSFEGIANVRSLLPGSMLRYPEMLFTPIRILEAEPYEPLKDGPGIALLNYCYLPLGKWQIKLHGSLPQPPKDQNLEIIATQSGNIIFSEPFNQNEEGYASVDITINQVAHEDPIAVFVSNYDIGVLDPCREKPFEMEARFLG